MTLRQRLFLLQNLATTSHTIISVFLSQDNVLCRCWTEKTKPVEQYVISETYVPIVLKLIHDMPTAGHPGRDRTLAAARRVYYWSTVFADIKRYMVQCISCAKHNGTTKGPPPDCLWDIVSIDLLQFPKSRFGSQYLLVCVDHFPRIVVLAPVKNKTAISVAHALVTRLICPYTMPRIL